MPPAVAKALRRSRAAREIAREYFAADRVLTSGTPDIDQGFPGPVQTAVIDAGLRLIIFNAAGLQQPGEYAPVVEPQRVL